jgi:deoxyribose-phosphate aldolase
MHDADISAPLRRLIACLDLTRLEDDDPPERIAALCAAAATPFGAPAAVCVYPEHIVTARRELARHGLDAVRIASVANFPDGSDDAGRAAREIRRALAVGADEIDLVMPWKALLAGDHEAGARVLGAARDICGARATLKVILETGALGDEREIRAAARIAIDAGADFIKTSTGKIAIGATPEAASIMLEVITERGGRCGFKAAGGVRTLADAERYVALFEARFGVGLITPTRFRLGASALLDDILRALGHVIGPSTQTY